MGNPYASVAVTGYNSNPPPDDGSSSAANEITWSGQKTKIGDPLKTAIDAVNTNIIAAFMRMFANSISSISTDYTALTSDQGKLLAASGTHTITLPAAATAATPFALAVSNVGVGTTTIDGNGSETIDTALTISLAAGEWAILICDGSNWRSLRITIPVIVPQITGLKNFIQNGGALVAQRSAPSLSTSFQYGAVDRFMVAATAGAVSAGTIAQDTASPAGRTGNSVKVAGATLTGSAVVSAKQRIESKDAVKIKNQNASFSVRVYQDTGSSVNYTITIKKPTVLDNYGATSTIATSSAIPVASATDTQITFINQALGDCSNGLEIQVDAACGAVTTKNLHFTEWQLEEGATVSAFERRPYALELRDCHRFVRPLRFQDTTFVGGAQVLSRGMTIEEMRTTPTVTASDVSGSSNITPSFTVVDAKTIVLGGTTVASASTVTAGNCILTADL